MLPHLGGAAARPCAPDSAPAEFLCPISQELMVEPVVAADGHSYDQVEIEKWFETGHRTSPMTDQAKMAMPRLHTKIDQNRPDSHKSNSFP